MENGKKISVSWYAVADYIAASLAWLCFYFYRSYLLDDKGAFPIGSVSWAYIVLIVPLFWIILYTLAGTYRHLYKKSRLEEFTLTFITSFFGCVILFIVFVSNDPQPGMRICSKLFLYCWGCIFFLLLGQDGFF
jgi:polysaccharide biosynthesis protein PslA